MDNDSTHERIKYVGVMTYETNRYPYYGAIHSVHNEYLTDFIGVCAESGCVYHGSSTISETKDSSIFPGSKAIDVKIKEDTRYYSIDSVHCVIRVRDCRYQTDRIGRIMNQYDFVTSTYK